MLKLLHLGPSVDKRYPPFQSGDEISVLLDGFPWKLRVVAHLHLTWVDDSPSEGCPHIVLTSQLTARSEWGQTWTWDSLDGPDITACARPWVYPVIQVTAPL